MANREKNPFHLIHTVDADVYRPPSHTHTCQNIAHCAHISVQKNWEKGGGVQMVDVYQIIDNSAPCRRIICCRPPLSLIIFPQFGANGARDCTALRTALRSSNTALH